MFKPRNLNPGPGRLIIPGLATLGILGVIVSSRRSSTDTSNLGARARAKRDADGLNGAGIGGNMQSGGTEAGAVTGKGDAERPVQTTAESRGDLPAGGVGGGHGAGNSNARAVEMRPSGSAFGEENGMAGYTPKQKDGGAEAAFPGNPSNTALSESGSPMRAPRTHQSASQRLQGVFHQGGSTAGEPGENVKKYHDPRIHSNLTDTPTRRGQMRSDS